MIETRLGIDVMEIRNDHLWWQSSHSNRNKHKSVVLTLELSVPAELNRDSKTSRIGVENEDEAR